MTMTQTMDRPTFRDRLHVDEIKHQAKHASPRRAAETVGSAPFVAAGYAARFVIAGLWAVAAWAFSALRMGWRLAGPKPELPPAALLAAENEMLREELARMRGGS